MTNTLSRTIDTNRSTQTMAQPIAEAEAQRIRESGQSQVEHIIAGFSAEFNWQDLEWPTTERQDNLLRAFFEARSTGPGIWKWEHYFDVYNRHLAKFRGRRVHILEIGVYSGGSLDMWADYFGDRVRIYGADIQPECKVYESDRVKIFIGDQGDREFWRSFKEQVPTLDIVIDDGSHVPEHQQVTLEELLPHLRPGGVFICEDMHSNWTYGLMNPFASYVHGLAHKLNHLGPVRPMEEHPGMKCPTTPFQSAVHSIHLYPFAAVIETNSSPVVELRAPRRGTEWQPFNPGQPRQSSAG